MRTVSGLRGRGHTAVTIVGAEGDTESHGKNLCRAAWENKSKYNISFSDFKGIAQSLLKLSQVQTTMKRKLKSPINAPRGDISY